MILFAESYSDCVCKDICTISGGHIDLQHHGKLLLCVGHALQVTGTSNNVPWKTMIAEIRPASTFNAGDLQ